MTPPAGVGPFTGGKLVAHDNTYLYLIGDGLLRVRKDLSAYFEVLLPAMPGGHTVFAEQGDSIYWVEIDAVGRLLSCPKTGCVGSPNVLMTGLYYPTAIAVDNESVYALEFVSAPSADDTVVTPSRIVKCPVTGCSSPAIVYEGSTNVTLAQLMVDDRFVYVGGLDCPIPSSPDITSGNCAFIEAIPK